MSPETRSQKDSIQPNLMKPLSNYTVRRRRSVDPKKFPDEDFELFSIPAYDLGVPEQLKGMEIGSTKKIVEPGDVLISRIVPHIQRVWLVPEANGKRQIASGEWIIFRGDDVAPEFLRHMLLAKPFHQQFMSTVAGVGGSLLRARPSGVEKIMIPVLQSIGEQRRIAAILDKADGIRRKREQALNMTDRLLQSAFLEMFGDPVSNPRGWRMGNIGDCLFGVVGGWSAKGDARPARADEMGVLKISAVTSGEYNPCENKVVSDIPAGKKLIIPKTGDLLFSRANTRDLVAATCIVVNEYKNVFLPDKIWKLEVNQGVAEPSYLKFILTHPKYRQVLCSRATGTSGSMLNISKSKLLDHPIPLPPLEKQRVFANYWKSVIHINSRCNQHFTEAKLLFSSLSQRAFRGEL